MTAATKTPSPNLECCSAVCAFASDTGSDGFFVCENQLSDHHGHVLHDDHFVCDEFPIPEEGEE